MILTKRSVNPIENSKWFHMYNSSHSFILYNGYHYDCDREFVKTGNSVSCFIRCLKEKKCLLIKQFRPALCLNLGSSNSWIYENVAGMKDDNESVIECAAREIKEETGISIHIMNISNIQKIAVSPGLISEMSYIVTADVEKTEELKPCGLENEQEKTLPLWVGFDDINKMIKNNEIFDAKTIIGLNRINNG